MLHRYFRVEATWSGTVTTASRSKSAEADLGWWKFHRSPRGDQICESEQSAPLMQLNTSLDSPDLPLVSVGIGIISRGEFVVGSVIFTIGDPPNVYT